MRVIACTIALLLFTSVVQSDEPKRLTFSILEDYDKGDDLADVAKDFALFRELGITTWRGSFGWDDYEPSRGHLDLDWLHRFADLAESHGITLRPYIAYTPEWASAGGRDKDSWNDPPARIADWAHFVRALAAAMRRHHNIASYEIYNEENVAQWWDGSATAYTDVLKRGSEAIRLAAPGTQVLLGGMVFPDSGWITQVCSDQHSAASIDVVAFHAYPETWTPEDVDLEHYLGGHFVDGFARTVDENCGRKPIWINEAGFANLAGKSEQDQADWWTRAIAVFAATPRVEHVGVYEIKDLDPTRAAIGDAPNYHLGITHSDRTKKPAFDAIKTLVRFFDRPFTVEESHVSVDGEGRVFSYTFRRDDGRRLVVTWTKRGSQTGHPRVVELERNGS